MAYWGRRNNYGYRENPRSLYSSDYHYGSKVLRDTSTYTSWIPRKIRRDIKSGIGKGFHKLGDASDWYDKDSYLGKGLHYVGEAFEEEAQMMAPREYVPRSIQPIMTFYSNKELKQKIIHLSNKTEMGDKYKLETLQPWGTTEVTYYKIIGITDYLLQGNKHSERIGNMISLKDIEIKAKFLSRTISNTGGEEIPLEKSIRIGLFIQRYTNKNSVPLSETLETTFIATSNDRGFYPDLTQANYSDEITEYKTTKIIWDKILRTNERGFVSCTAKNSFGNGINVRYFQSEEPLTPFVWNNCSANRLYLLYAVENGPGYPDFDPYVGRLLTTPYCDLEIVATLNYTDL
jgi:hypothetical protein